MIGHSNIVIYGTGLYSYDITLFLYKMGYKQDIICYVVSDGDYTETTYMGKNVYKVSEAIGTIGKAVVILAMKPESANDVIELVKALNPIDVISVSREQRQAIGGYNRTIPNMLGILPIENSRVFVDCFDGQGYQCNCKYIVKYLIDNDIPVEIIWNEEGDHDCEMPKEVKSVIRYSEDYYKALYTSRVIICNDEVKDLREDSKDKQYIIDTWHGAGPFKRDYLEIESEKNNVELKERMLNSFGKVDLFLSNCSCNSYKYRKAFLYDGEIMECGAPRNDLLFRSEGVSERVRERLGIDDYKKILLYAPTFRKDVEDSFCKYDLDLKKIQKSIEKRFGYEWIIIYRFHHMLYGLHKNDKYIEGGLDVTLYPDVMELLVASDILITDYSSIMWDFSLMRKPVFLYHNDIDEYDRGFYCDPEEWPYVKSKSTEDMCKAIEQFDSCLYENKLEEFFMKYKSYDNGHAAERVVERIIDVIKHPDKYGKR